MITLCAFVCHAHLHRIDIDMYVQYRIEIEILKLNHH